jgi:enoyl-CoA hydratase/carnithine racemase
MGYIEPQMSGGIATLMLRRGKVNALNGAVVDEMRALFKTYENDPEVKSIILTGSGKFFSFGFDIPEFLSFTKEQFTEYLVNFTNLLHTSSFIPSQWWRRSMAIQEQAVACWLWLVTIE